MAKYSYEFKKRIVEEYLRGKGSYEYIAKEHNILDNYNTNPLKIKKHSSILKILLPTYLK